MTRMGNELLSPCQPHVASDCRVQVAAIKLQIVPLPSSSCLVIWTQIYQGNNPSVMQSNKFCYSLSHIIKEIHPTQTVGFCSGGAQSWGQKGKKGLKIQIQHHWLQKAEHECIKLDLEAGTVMKLAVFTQSLIGLPILYSFLQAPNTLT